MQCMILDWILELKDCYKKNIIGINWWNLNIDYNNIGSVLALIQNLVIVLWPGRWSRLSTLFLRDACWNLGMNIVSAMNSKMFHQSNINICVYAES